MFLIAAILTLLGLSFAMTAFDETSETDDIDEADENPDLQLGDLLDEPVVSNPEPTLADFITDDHTVIEVTVENYGTIHPGSGNNPTPDLTRDGQYLLNIGEDIEPIEVYGGINIVNDSDTGTRLSANSFEGAAIFGNGGDDHIVGSSMGGANVLVGSDGDDQIIRNAGPSEIDGAEVVTIDAGDVIMISDTGALLTLGDGEDTTVLMDTSEGIENVTIFTDIDPDQDRVVLSVLNDQIFAPDNNFDDEPTSIEVSYTLTQVQTDLGAGTMASPDTSGDPTVSALEGTTSSHAILLGVTPDQLSDENIDVYAIMTGSPEWQFATSGPNLAGI
ncbi:MAG: hypothetical protein ACI91Z_000268 [Yoonia sp.]|jgi:hypothetical protein